MALGPPLPATILFASAPAQVVKLAGVAVAAHESFHGTSWIYPRADSRVPTAFVELQKVNWVPTSSKSVPPIAMLNGVDAIPLTASPRVAASWFAGAVAGSHAAEPLSPAEITTVIPSAAACCHKEL